MSEATAPTQTATSELAEYLGLQTTVKFEGGGFITLQSCDVAMDPGSKVVTIHAKYVRVGLRGSPGLTRTADTPAPSPSPTPTPPEVAPVETANPAAPWRWRFALELIYGAASLAWSASLMWSVWVFMPDAARNTIGGDGFIALSVKVAATWAIGSAVARWAWTRLLGMTTRFHFWMTR